MPLPVCIMEVRRSLSIVVLLVASGCSGATTTELFGPASQDESPTSPIAANGEDDSAGGSGISGVIGNGSSGGSSSGGSSSGTTTDGGAPGPDAAPAPNGCVEEKEPNDGPEMTEWFTECFSGAVKKGDIDYASISAPATATKIAITHKETGGGVRYRLYINGLQFGSWSEDPPELIPVFAGGTYSFEMSPFGTNGGARTYELDVKFE